MRSGEELTLAEHVTRRGLVAPGAPVHVEALGGGVSGDVFAVVADDHRLVVKRPLPRLRVEQEWRADVVRGVTEARALRLAAEMTPGAVPELLDIDEREAVLVMTCAPATWTVWRDDLFAGRIDEGIGRRLGTLLATWHLGTLGQVPERAAFTSTTTFEQLRIDPFHRTVAARHPELAGPIDAVVERLLGTRACLVHGDFSPKNILVDPAGDGLWVLDWEVAHLGDPTFDLAFMLTHLLLKAVHRPDHRRAYQATAGAFLDGYAATAAAHAGAADDGSAGAGALPISPALPANVGCLLLARIDGKSPADYLTAPERERVRALGVRLLADPPEDVLSAWEPAT